LARSNGWELSWLAGPNREQVRRAVAELAGPGFPAFTKILADHKLRTSRTISQRAWALHLLKLAAAGGSVPDLDDVTVRWTTIDHLEDEVAFPERATSPAVDAAAEELLSLTQALQPVVGQGQRVPADEHDLARLLARWGFEAIASGAARRALHDRAGVTSLTLAPTAVTWTARVSRQVGHAGTGDHDRPRPGPGRLPRLLVLNG
jgi:hypothetical protein